MNATTLSALLRVAALLHLGLLFAGASLPRAVQLSKHLASLPSFIRRLFYVYYSFIGSLLIGFGVLTFLFARPMAEGDPVARALCVLLSCFWLARLVVAAAVFDVGPYLLTRWHRLGYHMLNATFLYLVAVYVLAAWKGGSL